MGKRMVHDFVTRTDRFGARWLSRTRCLRVWLASPGWEWVDPCEGSAWRA